MHKHLSTAVLLSTLWPAQSGLMAQAYRIGVDPRVELMSILFRLAGNGEYAQGRVPAYLDAIDRHFAPYRNHRAVQLARELRQNDGVSFDAPMSMAVHISDAEALEERVPFDRPDLRLDKRWRGVKARQFLQEARRFVTDARFSQFLASQQPLYELTNNRLRAFVKSKADLEWYDRFFGTRPGARFIVVPGLVNGGPSYGASITTADGVEEMYAIPGVFEVDRDGRPQFESREFLNTMVHEFVHSYANRLVDRHEARLEKAGARLNEPVREAMRAQGYGAGKTLVYESLVRAATIRYVLDHEGPGAGRRAMQNELARSFLWMRELCDLLDQYERNRDTYPTLESFMPTLVEFFEDAATRPAEFVQRYEQSRPQVAEMSISIGASDVDPGLTAIIVRFDRPMNKIPNAPSRDPRVGRLRFDETGITLTIAVALDPGREYSFPLKWPGGESFTSVEGVPLKDLTVRFRTRGAN